MNFYKYHGTGNDFILIDRMNKNQNLILSKEQIALLCNRRFGIGADGLMILKASTIADFEMIYYNSDGNISSMCGNGGRCISQFYFDQGYGKDHVTFIAIDGLHDAWSTNQQIKLKMSDVQIVDRRDDNTFVLDTGSPHYVQIETDKTLIDNIFKFGQSIRYNDEFKNTGINVNIVLTEGANKIRMATYERGVEDETYSCGTGVVAASISYAIKESLQGESEVNVTTKGGDLSVSFKINDATITEIYLTGPARFVFSGSVDRSII